MLLKRILLSGPLLFLGVILCLTFAWQAVTTDVISDHRIYVYQEEILLDITGSSRVSLQCSGKKFEYASTWNETFQTASEFDLSDLIKRSYPDILLEKLDEACSDDYNPQTTGKIIYAIGALMLGVYFVWGFRSLMRPQ